MRRYRKMVIGLACVLLVGLLPSIVALSAETEGSDTFIATPTHYQDAEGSWHLINNEIVDGVMDKDAYTLSILQSTFDAGQIVEFSVGDSYVRFQPMPLQWTNDLGQIEQIAIPQEVVGVVTNYEMPPGSGYYRGSVDWANAYGAGRDFTFNATRNSLSKLLAIDSTLPTPAEFIIDGGEPVLRLSFIFDPSADLDIVVDGEAWDKKADKTTFDAIEFHKGGEYLWRFDPASYWDSSDGDEQSGVTTLRKVGNNLWVDTLVPYTWLLTAQYPIYVDPDVTIDAACQSNVHAIAARAGIFWTSPTVGYVVYVDVGIDLKYNKTTDGGATWGGAVNIVTGTVLGIDCWADWQTEGDAGTKIHIAYVSHGSRDIRYVYLDTDGDSIGGDDQIEACQGTGTLQNVYGRPTYRISITKTRGGNLAVAFGYSDDDDVFFYEFYTSPDGDTWTNEATPWEADDDHILLFPGNEADNQDVWALFWDASADILSLKSYDDSGDSWSEQQIAASMAEHGVYLQMDGAIRLSDGHLIVAAWSQYDNAASDLMTWDINGAGSITAKTNIITNTGEYFLASVFINQDNDDIYVAYVGGANAQSSVAAQYQKSADGGGTWDGEVQIQANADDDERWISCGAVKAANGGKFQPVWFNDDLNDLFCNTDNGISIAAAAGEAVGYSYGTIIG